MKAEFHKYLTVFRKQRGYTQAQLADKLRISRSTYANYESGSRSPDFETLERISDILNCTLDELFGRQRETEEGNHENLCGGYAETACESVTPYRAEGEKSRRQSKRKLLIGAQDFRYLRERNAYYVDKTQFVEQFLDSWYQVTLITRPRRFGKTLNMSMLAEFLDCTKDSEALFEGTKISKSEVIDEINQYPVVFLSFLNVRGDTPHEMIQQLTVALRGEYARYYPIINAGTLTKEQKRVFDQNYLCLCQNGSPEEKAGCLTHAIADLCQVLETYYNKKVYLLIDEYDTPFIAANSGGYYSQVRGLLAGMLSSALKGSSSLEKAVLTGIQRVAKENIFSGLNNLIVCTIADPDYDDCFGFTEDEVKELLAYCGMEFTESIREMYDGYRIGKADVYNPWSVSCYAARRELQSYWVNTSENSILKDALGERGRSFAEDYDKLIEQGAVEAEVELSAAYYEKPGDAALWGLLINAGMLTISEKIDENRYRLRVPNQEVWKAFGELTSYYLRKRESMSFFSEKYSDLMDQFGISKKMVLSTAENNIVSSRMMSVIQINGKLYFQTDKTFRKYRQIAQNPNVSLCIDNIQIEGCCKEIGRPLENNEFLQKFQRCFPDSYKRYSLLENEVLFEMTPTYIERWVYIDSVPFIEIYDVSNEEYRLDEYKGI